MRVRIDRSKFTWFVALSLAFAALLCVRAEELPKELSVDVGTNGVKMVLVLIPSGTFDMGSPETEVGRRKTETRHTVTISKPFYMGKYEVTQEQFESLMGENPSSTKAPNLPVERVMWTEAMKFCEKLSAASGRIVLLPTEAQWEYACRAGTTTPFNTGATLPIADANYTQTQEERNAAAALANPPAVPTTPPVTVPPPPLPVADPATGPVTPPVPPTGVDPATAPAPVVPPPAPIAPPVTSAAAPVLAPPVVTKTMPVGSFKPNAWGLYDMHGNVWEWCRDFYDENYYAESPAQDPEGPARSSENHSAHAARGGSFYSVTPELRSACRDCLGANDRNAHGGFRVIIQLDKP